MCFERTVGRERVLTRALSDVSFSVRAQEFVSIIGPSGCGKSTIVRIAAGLQRPTGGELRIGADPVTRPGTDAATVFQSPGLLPWRTVLDNVALPLEVAGMGKRERVACIRPGAADGVRPVPAEGLQPDLRRQGRLGRARQEGAARRGRLAAARRLRHLRAAQHVSGKPALAPESFIANEHFYRSVGEWDKPQNDSVMAYDLIKAGARETATSGGT
jgi:ABC-type sugar transport system ATPase subunit